MKIFGRPQLLAAGDIPVAQFVWSHPTWDLGRVEVFYQYMSATEYPFNRPFVVVRMFSLPYLARTAARVSRLCDHISSADTLAITTWRICAA